MSGISHKMLVMTDIHMTKPGRLIIGLDPFERFRACLEHAALTHPEADGLILMGDLTHHGITEQYNRLKEALLDLPWPVHLMLGNHDYRAKFVTAFPEAPLDPNGFVQQTLEIGDYRLVLLDTHAPERTPYHGGYLCEDRLEWLSCQLSGVDTGKAVVFMHHPPFVTGFPGMDAIGLEGQNSYCEIVSNTPSVAMTLSGHVHRTIWGVAGGKPAAVLKSPCHQMPMELTDEDSSLSVDEPGAYGVLLMGESGVVLLTEDVGLPPKPTLNEADSV